MKFAGSVIVFGLLVVYSLNQSIPYFKDMPNIINGNYKTEQGFIELVGSAGKDGQRDIDVNGNTYISSKIKPNNTGDYFRFKYLPNTKIIVHIKKL